MERCPENAFVIWAFPLISKHLDLSGRGAVQLEVKRPRQCLGLDNNIELILTYATRPIRSARLEMSTRHSFLLQSLSQD